MSDPIEHQLQGRRSELLQSISVAAKTAESLRVLELAGELQRTELLIARHTSLLEEASDLLGAPLAAPPNGTPRTPLPPASSPSGRGHGRQIRADFLEAARQQGLILSGYQGAIYKTPTGARIGIAVATERQQGRWFLGLTEGAFDAAVLLCQSNSGRTAAVCLPSSFIAQHRAHLSSSRGQNKFNVVRRNGHLMLSIPGQGHVAVDQFVDAVRALG